MISSAVQRIPMEEITAVVVGQLTIVTAYVQMAVKMVLNQLIGNDAEWRDPPLCFH